MMTGKRPHELVRDASYFQGVLKSMEIIPVKEERRVRFGLKGEGIAPHYEVTYPDGHVSASVRRPFNGLSHKPHHQSPVPFEEEHLTEKFSWTDVQALLKSARSPRD